MTRGLGALEQAVLLSIYGPSTTVGKQAYGRAVWHEVQRLLGRAVAPGAVYATLQRLQVKRLVSSRQGEAPARGGVPKRHYAITPDGLEALARTKIEIDRMWAGFRRRTARRVRRRTA
jgi:DNA-binding PadR family transcriptional regulator